MPFTNINPISLLTDFNFKAWTVFETTASGQNSDSICAGQLQNWPFLAQLIVRIRIWNWRTSLLSDQFKFLSTHHKAFT